MLLDHTTEALGESLDDLAMIVPVILLASGLASVNFYSWLVLAALIVFGG